MFQENLQLLDKLYETFPTTNKNRILEFYLNIILVLEGARPSYSIGFYPPKPKTRYDLLNIVLDMYPDTFEIFKLEAPFIFLKSNSSFITSLLEEITFLNIGIALGYCCPISRADTDLNLMSIRLIIIANQINGKTKTILYSFDVPIDRLNETIMNSVYNKITNYNEILKEYGYSVSLQTELLWSQNNIKMVNCNCLNKRC
jgi:hypothetical protein